MLGPRYNAFLLALLSVLSVFLPFDSVSQSAHGLIFWGSSFFFPFASSFNLAPFSGVFFPLTVDEPQFQRATFFYFPFLRARGLTLPPFWEKANTNRTFSLPPPQLGFPKWKLPQTPHLWPASGVMFHSFRSAVFLFCRSILPFPNTGLQAPPFLKIARPLGPPFYFSRSPLTNVVFPSGAKARSGPFPLPCSGGHHVFYNLALPFVFSPPQATLHPSFLAGNRPFPFLNVLLLSSFAAGGRHVFPVHCTSFILPQAPLFSATHFGTCKRWVSFSLLPRVHLPVGSYAKFFFFPTPKS